MPHLSAEKPAVQVGATDHPLVSVFHMTHNQPEGLREALLASLSQDYPNLEIVVSDDCSSDETFDIVQEVLAEYDGPHQVRAFRNDQNLRVVGNVNTAIERTRGQLIVQTNGDDVSRPDRVSRLVAAWQADPQARLVFSTTRWVDKDGEVVKLLNTRPEADYQVLAADYIIGRLYATGAGIAYDRRIFDEFGPLPDVATVEDTILPFRARMIGTVRKVEDILVDMPIGGISWFDGTASGRDRMRKKVHMNMVNNRKAVLLDIKGRAFPGKLRLVLYCRLFLLANAFASRVPHRGRLWKMLKGIDTWIRRGFAHRGQS